MAHPHRYSPPAELTNSVDRRCYDVGQAEVSTRVELQGLERDRSSGWDPRRNGDAPVADASGTGGANIHREERTRVQEHGTNSSQQWTGGHVAGGEDGQGRRRGVLRRAEGCLRWRKIPANGGYGPDVGDEIGRRPVS